MIPSAVSVVGRSAGVSTVVTASAVFKLSDVTVGSLVDEGFELGVVNASLRFSPTFCLNFCIKFPGGL